VRIGCAASRGKGWYHADFRSADAEMYGAACRSAMAPRRFRDSRLDSYFEFSLQLCSGRSAGPFEGAAGNPVRRPFLRSISKTLQLICDGGNDSTAGREASTKSV
jgi:hypothetical protein